MVNRREFIAAAGTGALVAVTGSVLAPAVANAAVSTAALSLQSTLPKPQPLVHLLNRISFGIKQGDLEYATALGAAALLEEQLNPERIDDSAVEQAVAAQFPTLSLAAPALLTLPKKQVTDELQRATVYRALFSKRQLFEVMVEFWGDHFNISQDKMKTAYLKTVDDRDVIRRHALGNFPELLHASAKSPAMLYYLDNIQSTRSGPNENYARELLELHTLGVDGGYTEQDVQNAARCFTGWGIYSTSSSQHGEFKFRSAKHDQGSKQVLGLAIPSNQGIRDGEQVLDHIARHPATARHIATKLARRFVSDEPSAALIDAIATTFRNTDGEIRAMLRTLFNSSEFTASADRKLKRPTEYLYSALRAADARLTNDAVAGCRSVLTRLAGLGQVPFEWDPPNGYPVVAAYWTGPAAMFQRTRTVIDIGLNDLVGFSIDVAALTGGSTTSSAMVDQVTAALLRRPILARHRDVLIAAVDRNAGKSLADRAGALIGQVLASPYFQYR